MAADIHDLLDRVAAQKEPQEKPPWTTQDEIGFQKWYAEKSKQYGLDPNPDSPLHFYDYRQAFKAGADAQVIAEDNLPHWPSTFKKLGHPNLIVKGEDTRTGERATPELYGENQLAHKFIAEGGIPRPAADATRVAPRANGR